MINTALFVAFIVGIIIGWLKVLNILVLCFLSFLSFSFLYFSSRLYRRPHLFLVSFVFFFFILGAIWVNPYSLKKPEDFIGGNRVFLIKVTSLPRQMYLKDTFYAQVMRADGFLSSFKVKVNSFSHRNMKYRSSYLVVGRLSARKFKHSIFYTLWIKKGSLVKELPPNLIDNFVRRITLNLVSYFKKYLSLEAYKFSSSVFLGRRELATRELSLLFKKAGVAHLFAISGLHVGLISMALFFALKILRIKFRARLLIVMLFMFIFALCAGLRPSIVRASIMFFFLGAAFFLKRRVSVYDSLSVAGIVCLLLNPLWVFDVGFQLSFISVLGIVAGFSIFDIPLNHRLFLVNYIKAIFFSTIFVFLAIFPLVSLYFGGVYLSGIVSNVILIPVFTLILILILVFVGLYIFPFLAAYIAPVLSLSVFIFLRIASLMSKIKIAYFAFSIDWGGVVFYYAALLLTGAIFLRRSKFKVSLSV